MKISTEILNMKPYKPGKPIEETRRELGLSHVIKLASNENPLGPSPRALAAISRSLSDLHRYPDPSCFELRKAVAAFYQVPENCLVFGNGSDELVDLLARIFLEPGESILTSEKAFVAYQLSAQASRARVLQVPLDAQKCFDLNAMAEVFKKQATKPRLIFIANPNNPTGTYVAGEYVEALLSVVSPYPDTLVVFDEAYVEFVRAKDYTPAHTYLKRFKNVVVLRTMSKIFGLAGLRLGVMMAQPEVVDIVHRVRKPFNVNSLAQVAAVAALEDRDYIKQVQQITWQGLDYFYSELKRLGLPYLPSQGNFVLFDTLREALKVYQAMLKQGVIVRPVDNYGFARELRLSVGQPEENTRAIKALEIALNEVPLLK